MEMYYKKMTMLVEVLKLKVKRLKERFKDLELLVDGGAASSRQKQEFIELKAKIEAYEDSLDLAEGMIETIAD